MTRTLVGVALLAIAFATANPPQARSESEILQVESALVLYMDRDIPDNGGDIMKALKEALAPDALGAVKLRALDQTGQALADFRSRFPRFMCYGAWRGSKASPAEEGAQSDLFFEPLVEVSDARGQNPLCDQNARSLPERWIGFPVTSRMPDIYRYGIGTVIKSAMSDVAPRNGEPGKLEVTVCPRLRQFRRAAFGGAQLRAEADALVERVRDILADIDVGKGASLAEQVRRGPMTLLVGGAVEDLKQSSAADYNIIDVFVRATLETDGERASACLQGVDGRVPALAAQSVKVTWNSKAHLIPDAPKDGEQAQATDGKPATSAADSSGTAPGARKPKGKEQTSQLNALGTDHTMEDLGPGAKAVEPTEPGELRAQILGALAKAAKTAKGEGYVDGESGNIVFVVEGFESVSSRATANTGRSTDLSKDRATALAEFLREAGFTVLTEGGFGFTDLFYIDPPGMASVAIIPRDETMSPNQAAIATAILLPPVAALGARTLEDMRETIRDGAADRLERAATPREKCISNEAVKDRKASISKYLDYFVGEDYRPFSEVAEHDRAVILLCAASGTNGEAFRAEVFAPHILRSLNSKRPDLKQSRLRVRAGFLHEIDGPRGPRYYLFGHSVLTHFQRGTKASDIRHFCEEFPGLQLSTANRRKDVCARANNGAYVVSNDAAVDDTLYHAVLPSELQDQVSCAPRLDKKPVGQPPNQSMTFSAVATEANCEPEDILRDPRELFEALSGSDHVYRAAMDVAFDFSRGTGGARR